MATVWLITANFCTIIPEGRKLEDRVHDPLWVMSVKNWKIKEFSNNTKSQFRLFVTSFFRYTWNKIFTSVLNKRGCTWNLQLFKNIDVFNKCLLLVTSIQLFPYVLICLHKGLRLSSPEGALAFIAIAKKARYFFLVAFDSSVIESLKSKAIHAKVCKL